MDLAPFAAFLVASLVGLGLSVLTFVFARRSGLAPLQTELVQNLKDNADALDKRVEFLETEVERERRQRMVLQDEVKQLRDTVADLAAENSTLRKKLNMATRE